MGRLGFEPGANRLKAGCSTAELAPLAMERDDKSPRPDSGN